MQTIRCFLAILGLMRFRPADFRPDQDRIQPRRAADPGGELLRLPRPRQRLAQGRPAARPARRRHQGGAIVPGKPDKSALIARIFTDDPKQLMPPPKSHKKLTAAQKETLRRWIAQGPSISRTGRSSPRSGPQLPKVKNADLAAQSDRPLSSWPSWRSAACAGAGSRSPHAGPPPQPRPDRAAAGAGRRGGVRQRQGRRTPTRNTSTSC